MLTDRIRTALQDANLVLALVRDSILSAVGILTVIIVYLGGDPKELSSVQWVQIIAASALVVIGPTSICVGLHFVGRANELLYGEFREWLYGSKRVPRGVIAWMSINVFRQSRRQYIRQTQKVKSQFLSFSEGHQRGSTFIRFVLTFLQTFSIYPKWLLAVYAVLMIGFSGFVFLDFLQHYT